mgnify:CR=1 FL=1
MPRPWQPALVACALAVSGASGPAEPDRVPVRVGVQIERGETETRSAWQPTADHLGAALPDRVFALHPMPASDLRSAAERGALDFAICDPGIYAELEQRQVAFRIATLLRSLPEGAVDRSGAVLFSRSDRDDLLDVASLRGRSFAAVDAESFAGWRMARRELARAGIAPESGLASIRFAGSPEAVVRDVQDGRADAGSVPSGTLERMTAQGEIVPEDFRILDESGADEPGAARRSTPRYPEWAFAATRDTPSALVRRTAAALLQMTPASPAVIAAGGAGWSIPLDYQPVRDCLRELGILPGDGADARDGASSALFAWLLFILAATGLAFALLPYPLLLRTRRTLEAERLRRQRAESERDRHRARLEILAGLHPQAAAAPDAPWDKLAPRLASLLEADCFGFFEHTARADSLRLRAGDGWLGARVGSAMVRATADSPIGKACATGRPVVFSGLRSPSAAPSEALLDEHEIDSGLAAPVPGRGVIAVCTKRRRSFTTDEMEFVGMVACRVAALLDRPGEGGTAEGDGDPAVLRARERVAELAPRYLEKRRRDVETIRASLAKSDFETVRRIGSDLKGTGRSYGFETISDLGRLLEEASQRKDPDSVNEALGRLVECLDKSGS